MEKKKFCSVSARICRVGQVWILNRNHFLSPMTLLCDSEFREMEQKVELLSYVMDTDRWRWNEDGNKDFSIQSVKRLLQKNTELQQVGFVLKWVNWVPSKCNIMVWRAEMGRLAVKTELLKRNINVGSLQCNMCDWGDDSVVHLFTACFIAQEVWSAIGKWCRLSPIIAFEVKDLLQLYKEAEGGKWGKIIVHGIIVIACWFIWRARNESVFQEKKTTGRIIIANIKRMSFFWCKHRSKFKDLSWDNWLISPLYMLY
ncbi:RNA-directed DNA polymerase, eukaryota, Reverse transcriptase zinc-binding domain protein [Artemisia annua]|uniref:RNA-directed DNA polymerase, eukaryota, Reverse transcriptase zinc-binding domain protein n=1 Tax=Artemisia annua TaxID=35608 RepID=A0A2U1KQV1_ARTAN|nr:RNA-directed DNA polymerase, eukaryota, Reverse transcriptase zinc-binding domain protein [Artemisia annua]